MLDQARQCAAVLLLFIIAGCTSDPAADTATDGSSASASDPPDPRDCRQDGRGGSSPGEDIEGQATNATLWALPFERMPFPAGETVKIVWRMTGSGPLRLDAAGPAGTDPDALQWGPEPHPGSNWHRPGDEWGTGLRFAEPGCWRVTVRRGEGIGAVWFTVR